MPIQLNGATSGSTTLVATDAVTATITLPSSTTSLAGLTTPSFTSTIGVGGATPASSGAGITFPATQSASTDANTLDDYEEGTWTPTQGANLTVVGSFSSGGTYTKIGRMVYVSGYLAGSTSVAFTSGGTISGGLPFSAITSPQQPGSGIIGLTTAGNTTLAYNTAVYAANAQTATSVFYFNIAYQAQ